MTTVSGSDAGESRMRCLVPVVLLLAIFIGSTLAVRPLLPIDETRYVSVAWEMRVSGDFLVPHLNGEIYAQKPPLFFWLINAGWTLLGVNDWWPRVVSPLAAVANFLLLGALARRLWPERHDLAAPAIWVLLGIPMWTFFSSMASFEMLLTMCALLTHLGWILAWRCGKPTGFLLTSLGIGAGILTKGPVILLHTVPVLFFAPFWAPAASRKRKLALLSAAAILGGIVIALAWAIPAGIAGGAAYREQIFHGQTAGRVLNSFAHRQPWWWYLPLIPALIFPWLLAPAFWDISNRTGTDPGSTYCTAWAGAALAGFSVISGKQIYYLVAELPAFALIIAFAFRASDLPKRNLFPKIMAGLYVLLGLFLALAPSLHLVKLPVWAANIPPLWGMLVIALALALLWTPAGRAIPAVSTATVFVLVIAQTGGFRAAGPTFDLRAPSEKIAGFQSNGEPVAFVGTYHAQFQFLGRLQRPLEEIGTPLKAVAWAGQHPRGMIVTVCEAQGQIPEAELAHLQPYRAKRLAIWPAAAVLRHPLLFLGAVR